MHQCYWPGVPPSILEGGVFSDIFNIAAATKTNRRDEEEEKRDFSLRKPTNSQERVGKKKRRLAPFEMTGGSRGPKGKKVSA
jgi:hypothetical protein